LTVPHESQVDLFKLQYRTNRLFFPGTTNEVDYGSKAFTCTVDLVISEHPILNNEGHPMTDDEIEELLVRRREARFWDDDHMEPLPLVNALDLQQANNNMPPQSVNGFDVLPLRLRDDEEPIVFIVDNSDNNDNDAREVHYEQVQATIVEEELSNTIRFERNFEPHEMDMIVRGVRAASMEDKWNIDYNAETNQVKFERSWTPGRPIFIMDMDMSQMKCVKFKFHSCLLEQNDILMIAFMFNVVLDHVVLERPFPVPFVFGEAGSMMIWQWIGRRALITA
jgi:hypothetical protein